MQPYKVYCGSVGRLAFNRRYKAMVMLKLFNQPMQADEHEQIPSEAVAPAAVHAENKTLADANDSANVVLEMAMYNCDEWIDGDWWCSCVRAPTEAGGVNWESETNLDNTTTAATKGEQQPMITLSALKRAMTLCKLRGRVLHMGTHMTSHMQLEAVQSWQSQALAAAKSRRVVKFWCSQMLAAVDAKCQAVVAARRATAAAYDSDSSSDAAELSDNITFIGGEDDPDTFVRAVRIVTATRQPASPIELLGELVVRMADRNEADLVLDWMDSGRGPRGERLVSAKADSQQQIDDCRQGWQLQTQADSQQQISDCRQGWQLQTQAMFAAEFPVAHEHDTAEMGLTACRQTTTMGRHITTYNRRLASSRICVNSTAARLGLTNRAERRRFINSCIDELPKELKSVWPPKAYLLKNIHKFTNMQLLQEAAKAYCQGALASAAFEVGLDDNY